MFTWLDGSDWASKWANGAGDRTLEVAVGDAGSKAAEALHDLPWEVLAYRGDFLAADRNQAFRIYRSIGAYADDQPKQPEYSDLAVMFMAVAPEHQRELDFEAEEAAILDATARMPIQLLVEESGCRDFLHERLTQGGPFEAVHISCHGDIHRDRGPVLALETPEGGLALTAPGDLAITLGESKAPLVFLSACRTAELLDGRAGEERAFHSRTCQGWSTECNRLGWLGL